MRDTIKAEPFRIAVPDEVLADLKTRLAQTRWPIEATAPAWTYGAPLSFMHQVVDYWRDRYDWRKSEAALNRFPNYKANIDGKQVHFILERGSGPDPLPLILTHGWPGSVVEFLDIIEPLAHPERFGGDAADGFTVVVPSLPGYGFSDPPDAPIAPREIAPTWSKLMIDVLGCDRYVAQGGDWGGIVTSWLALDRPERLKAIHLNIVGFNPEIPDSDPLTAEEEDWVRRNTARRDGEIAYHQINGTKPQTLSYGLTDSPAGLAAWILEKFHGWTVPGQDIAPPFDRDHLLANVMLYWLNGSNAASWFYKSLLDGSGRKLPQGRFVDIPTAMLLFPSDIAVPAPNRWIERSYNLIQRHDAPRGGHFGAFEEGPLFVEDVREFFRAYR
jgi:pimeloyl-ACP methyl ester carboxylesterase